MLKKKGMYILLLVFGIVLMVMSFLIQEESLKTLSGLCIGVGAGLFGMSLANLIMIRYDQKNPAIAKQNTIEYKYERNEMIRHKAKAKAGDILHWAIMGLAWLFILVDAPLWMILTCVALFVSYTALGFYFMHKYDQEL